jgi:hypothetical protein
VSSDTNIDNDIKKFITNLGKNRIRQFSISPNGQRFFIISGEWFQDVVLLERNF